MTKLFTTFFALALLSMLLVTASIAQVSTGYTFASSSGTYTEIDTFTGTRVAIVTGTSGNVPMIDEVIFNLPNGTIPFTFSFNGTGYTGCNISSNGFITFGTTPPATLFYIPISGTTTYDGCIAPFGRDIQGITAGFPLRDSLGEIRYATFGSTPNQTFVVQWKNFRRFSSGTGDSLNFQIILYETLNKMQVVYGPTRYGGTGSGTPQVGMRGSANSDFNNRTTATDWSSTTAGVVNTATCTFGSGVTPINGLTYEWTLLTQTYQSSTTTQNNVTSVPRGVVNQEIIGIQVVTPGLTNPLSVTSMTFSTNGSTSTSDITAAKLFYTGSVGGFSTTTQLGATVNNPNGSFTVSGFSQLLASGTNYFWLAYDISASATTGDGVDGECDSLVVAGTTYAPTVQAPAGNRQILLGLNGTYTVGTSGNYSTLTAALTDLNSLGVEGLTIFVLIDPVYSSSETFPLTINAISGSSATNTITIKPFTGNTVSITGTSTAIFVLNGADYVTIDGSNNWTTSRDLTITNQSTSVTSAVVWGRTTSGSDATTNNTIKNINLTGNANTQTLIGVGFGGTTIAINSLGNGNNNNTIQNCSISKTQFGIYSSGASVGNKNSGTIISNNLINTASPDNVKRGGILVNFEDNIQITGNQISGIDDNSSADCFGISLGLSPTQITINVFTGSEVTNAIVANNIIGSIIQTATFSAAGIAIASATSGTNTIYNNSIVGVNANGTSPDFAVGIYVGGGVGSTTLVYYNTVSMTGNRNTGATPPAISSYSLAIGGSNPVVDVRNNILINTQTTIAAPPPNSYAIGLAYATYSSLTSDYNDLYVSGANGIAGKVGSLVQGTGTNVADLATWQATTTRDANSRSIAVNLTSDGHIDVVSYYDVNLIGTPLSGYTTDIDGETRNSQVPYKGADEAPPIPRIAVSVDTLSSTLDIGDTTSQILGIHNIGNGVLTFTISEQSLPSILLSSTRANVKLQHDVTRYRDSDEKKVRRFDPSDYMSKNSSAGPAITKNGSQTVSAHRQVTISPRIQKQVASGIKVLILGDGATENDAGPILTAAGYDVTIGPTENNYDGTNPVLSSFSAVVLFDGLTYALGIPLSGQDSLVAFVNRGGGFLFTEWVAYDYYQQGLDINLLPLLLASGRAYSEGTATYNVLQSHPVTAGLPDSFQVTSAFDPYNGAPLHGTVLISYSGGGNAVTVDNVGNGKVAEYSMAANFNEHQPFLDGNMQLLFVNTVKWLTTPGWLTVNPKAGSVLFGDSTGIAVRMSSVGLVTGDYYTNILISSNDTTHLSDTVVAHLHVTNVVLPIQLATFTASAVTAGVKLEWMTVSEINNYGFYVERRPKGMPTFSTVSDLIAGAGTTLEEHQYTWTDQHVPAGNNVYRLRQVDLNGDVSYSHEIIVNGVLGVRDEAAPREFSLKQNYPNPFNPTTMIKFSVEKTEHATLMVYNMLGQEVARLFNGMAEPGHYYRFNLDASNFSTGLYIYRIVTDSRNDVKKMLLLK